MQHIYQRDDGTQVRGTLRDGSFNIALNENDLVLTVDDEGRPWTIWRGNQTLRRSYSGTVMEVRRGQGGRRDRRYLDAGEWLAAWEPLRRALEADIRGPAAPFVELVERMSRAVAMTGEALRADASRYRALYGGLGVLPPDAYLDVVLQLVEGCPFNRCSFCTFYRERAFQTKSVDEFAAHLEAVAAYYGRAIPMRRRIFLADADALAAPDTVLLAALEQANDWLPDTPIAAFTSGFTRPKRAIDVYREARARNLRRVHIGVESGSPEVLSILGKPLDTERTLRLVEHLKAANIDVGVIFLVGAGGHRCIETHFDASVALVRAMALEPSDIVYLSELVTTDTPEYLDRLESAGAHHLDEAALSLQSSRFKEALRAIPNGPKVARYDIRDFLD